MHISTPRPDAKRIYPKVRFCKPYTSSVGLVCIIGKTVMAEKSSFESGEHENKYYRDTCKTSCMGGAASSLPAIRRCTGNEDVASPGFCKCLYNICCELQNLVSIAKVSAPFVFAEGKEYNKRRSFGGSVKSL